MARGQLATVFPNLGGDAHLVVPIRQSRSSTRKDSFGHLANFTRGAPEEEQVELWRQAGCAIQNALKSTRVIWVNTDGRGVAWVHVRLDMQPKYIKHHPYCRRPQDRARQSREHGAYDHADHGTAGRRGKRGKTGRGAKRGAAPPSRVPTHSSDEDSAAEGAYLRAKPRCRRTVYASGRVLQHAVAAAGGATAGMGALSSWPLPCV